jgi:hypothetical protein
VRPRRRAARDAALVLLGLPLGLLGIVVHGPAYRATVAAVRALRPEADESATYQLAAGLVLFPLSWALEAALLAWAAGPWAAILFAALLVPSGVHALRWRERLWRLRRDVGAWARGDLTARQRWLRQELEALAALTSS